MDYQFSEPAKLKKHIHYKTLIGHILIEICFPQLHTSLRICAFMSGASNLAPWLFSAAKTSFCYVTDYIVTVSFS